MSNRAVMQEAFRLRPVTRRGCASTIPKAWTRYASPEEARAAARRAYDDERVARVMLVRDSSGRSAGWIER